LRTTIENGKRPRRDKAGQRQSQGSNPARISIIQMAHPARAEIFALPPPKKKPARLFTVRALS